MRSLVALAGATCLVGAYLAVPMVANAAGTTAVSFANAKFSGYGTGTEVGLTAATIGGTSLAAVGQGLSSAATNTAGLTAAQNSVPGNIVNPVEPASVKAYGSGSGADLGLATTPGGEMPVLGGRSQAIAPPISSEMTSHLTNANLGALGSIGTLDSAADAVYDAAGQTCPLGQPISFGLGDAANANLLNLSSIPGVGALTGSAPVLNTAGTGTSTANSTSETFLSSNGDGTFGLTSQSQETIAPITINVLGLLSLQLTVAGATPNSPVTLDSIASGEAGKPGRVTLANDDVINLQVSVAGGAYMNVPNFPVSVASLGPAGVQIPLSTTGLGTAVTSALNALTSTQLLSILAPVIGGGSALGMTLGNLLNTAGMTLAPVLDASLGTLSIDAAPFAIGGVPGSAPTQAPDGTAASGQIDLVHLNLGLSGTLLGQTIPTALSQLANLYVGHLEASAALAAPITCSLSVAKTANPPVVTAGDNFITTIMVPDPAKLNLLDCSLNNLSVVDSISDVPGGSQPTFQVLSASNGGKINQTSTTTATVSFTGLSYIFGGPPVSLTVTIAVPKSSPAGTIQDIANATGTAAGCTGGASGMANLGNVNGAVLNGSFKLVAPKVNAAPAATLAAQTGEAAGPGITALPRTGGEGGLWQPALGIGILILGGGALGLVRRSRRRPTG